MQADMRIMQILQTYSHVRSEHMKHDIMKPHVSGHDLLVADAKTMIKNPSALLVCYVRKKAFVQTF